MPFVTFFFSFSVESIKNVLPETDPVFDINTTEHAMRNMKATCHWPLTIKVPGIQ